MVDKYLIMIAEIKDVLMTYAVQDEMEWNDDSKEALLSFVDGVRDYMDEVARDVMELEAEDE